VDYSSQRDKFIQSQIYFKTAITDRIGYSFRTPFNNDQRLGDIRHGIAANILNLNVQKQYTHSFNVGIDNIGWNESNATTEPIFDAFAMYTLTPHESPFKFHFGAAHDISVLNDTKISPLAGFEYHFRWGDLTFEYDSNAVNWGVRVFQPEDHYAFYMAFVKDYQDDSDSLVRLGFSFLDNTGSGVTTDHSVMSDSDSPEKGSVEEDLSTPGTEALYHIQKGMEYYYDGQLVQAAVEYELVTEAMPTYSLGHERLGSIYFDLKQLEKAKKHWKKAYILRPSKALKNYLEQIK